MLEQTIAVVEVSTRLLLSHRQLLVLSPVILFACILISLPFMSLIFRLLLIGYAGQSGGVYEWHIRAYAGWLIFGAIIVWLWTWFIARGVLRVTSAAVVGAWYFRG